MRKFNISLFSLILAFPAFSQNSVRNFVFPPTAFAPKENTISYKLGDRLLQLRTSQYGASKNLVYINVHDDEVTSVNGAKKILEKFGGLLIRIENYRTRNIRFKLNGQYYTFDPNRM